MKLIPIDPNNLCKDYVLAYSVSEKKLIGKLANMNGDVVCVSHETSLSNISHYLPLEQIKPESDRVRTYLLWVSYISNHFGRTAYSHREATLTRINDNPIHDQIKDFLAATRNAFAVENSMPINAIVQLSFSCTETT